MINHLSLSMVPRFGLCCVMTVVIATHSAQADITATGQVAPSYAGVDPWTLTGALSIGNTGPGSLTIDAGSSVTTSSASFLGLGSTGSGEVTVSGSGSTWQVGSSFRSLAVGSAGFGTLTIEAGGVVRSGESALGIHQGSTGTTTVMGSGSAWQINGKLFVGLEGNGTIDISAGGVVSATSVDIGGLTETNRVTVTGGDSALNVTQEIRLGWGGDARLDIMDGAIVSCEDVVINSLGILKINSGELLPSGSVAFKGGKFHKVVTGPGDPHITAGGGLQIDAGSTLEIDLHADYTPALNDSITLFNTSENALKPFDNLVAPTLSGGLVFSQVIVPSGLGSALQLIVTIAGDTDGDGDIDDSDLGSSFANYTGPVAPGTGDKTWADGDTDGDGDVDDSDLGTSFAGYTGPFAPSHVPEPASFLHLTLGGVALARRRR